MSAPSLPGYLRDFYRGNRRVVVMNVAASIAHSLFLLPIAFLVRYAFDELIANDRLAQLPVLGLALVGLYLAGTTVALLARNMTVARLREHALALRIRLLERIMAAPRSFYTHLPSGDLHVIVAEETQRLERLLNGVFGKIMPAGIVTLALTGVLIYLDWFLFLLLVLIVPILYAVQKYLHEKARRLIRKYHRAFDRMYRGIMFLSQKMDLVRIQGAESFESARQRDAFQDVRDSSVARDQWNHLYRYSQENILMIAGVVVMVFGGMAVSAGDNTLGNLLSFYLVIGLVRNQLSLIAEFVPFIVEGSESLGRLRTFLQSGGEPVYRGTRRIDFDGRVTLEHVAFAYGDTPVLVDASLSTAPGRCTALVGRNGSGKSTITSLILGFYRPDQGRLRAGGVDYDEVDMIDLHRQIGVVSQTPMLFAGSLFENISYGFPEATHEQVELAARRAGAHTFIRSLPAGYDSRIGEGGVLLSGGQHQRVALARALLREPRLLILDEPTNHLDNDSIADLIYHLQRLPGSPAILLISHNSAVLELADDVVLLEDGITGQPACNTGHG